MKLTLYTDGCCRDPQRWSGAGVVVLLDGEPVAALSVTLEPRTCQQAEQEAILRGLELAAVLQAREVTIRTDCQVIAEAFHPETDGSQLRRWLQDARRHYKKHARRFQACAVEWVPGTENLAHAWARAGLPPKEAA